MSSLSNTLLYIQQKTIQSISWIYIIFGITGCLLNILLFSQKQFRSISCCIYFLVASVVMLCQLSIYAIPSVYSFYYRNPLTYIVVYCKIRMFLVQTTNLTYRWAYTAASFDRYAMSSSNARLRALATVPIAIRVLVGIMLFWAIFSAYIIALYDIQSNTCGLFNNTTATLFTTLSSIIFGGITPAVIMIVTTLLIRKNLKEKTRTSSNSC